MTSDIPREIGKIPDYSKCYDCSGITRYARTSQLRSAFLLPAPIAC